MKSLVKSINKSLLKVFIAIINYLTDDSVRHSVHGDVMSWVIYMFKQPFWWPFVVNHHKVLSGEIMEIHKQGKTHYRVLINGLLGNKIYWRRIKIVEFRHNLEWGVWTLGDVLEFETKEQAEVLLEEQIQVTLDSKSLPNKV